jgi:hypothetical protein
MITDDSVFSFCWIIPWIFFSVNYIVELRFCPTLDRGNTFGTGQSRAYIVKVLDVTINLIPLF